MFQQLSDESSTWTYLLGDPESREALLIDPVLEQVDTYINLLETLKLNLAYTLETFAFQADHVTASGELRENAWAQNQSLVMGAQGACANIQVCHHDTIRIGGIGLEPLRDPIDTPTAA